MLDQVVVGQIDRGPRYEHEEQHREEVGQVRNECLVAQQRRYRAGRDEDQGPNHAHGG